MSASAKPRAKPINAQWAALNAEGMAFVFVPAAMRSPLGPLHIVNIEHEERLQSIEGGGWFDLLMAESGTKLKHVRKGSILDRFMAQAVARHHLARAAIATAEARKEAAKLSASARKAKPASRARTWL